MKVSEIKIDTPVIFWGIVDENGQKFNPLKTVIVSEPWELGHGAIVCKVAGISGGVLISHLEKVIPGSRLAAEISDLEGGL